MDVLFAECKLMISCLTKYLPAFSPVGTVSLHKLGLPSHILNAFWNHSPVSMLPSNNPFSPILNQCAVSLEKVAQSFSALSQYAIQAIMGPTVCTQYEYTAVMFSPARMGIYARAGVPGVLQERDVFVVSKMGLLETHFRCGIHAAASCMVWSP